MTGPLERLTPSSQYPFPWGLVAGAMAASALFGIAAMEVFVGQSGWTGSLMLGIAGIAYSLYGLRHEARLWRQRLAREADIAALGLEEGAESPSVDRSPSRPAS